MRAIQCYGIRETGLLSSVEESETSKKTYKKVKLKIKH